MTQKYKVFIGETPLLIIENEPKSFPGKSTSEISQGYLEGKPRECYQNILNSTGKEWVCFSENPLQTWTAFRSAFTLISAAGGIVFNPENKVLFIFRHGKWDLPKGKMENNERTEETAVREVEEECGIQVLRLDEPAGTTWHTYERDGKIILKPSYWFYMYSEDRSTPNPQLEEGITEVQWLDREEIKDRMSAMYPSIREIAETAILSRPKP